MFYPNKSRLVRSECAKGVGSLFTNFFSHLGRTWIRLSLGLAVTFGVLTGVTVAFAQAPVIIGDADLNLCSVNEQFDPVTDSWSTRTPIPVPFRESFAAAQLDDHVFIFGGAKPRPLQDERLPAPNAYLDEVLEYDPSLDAWSVKASMPTARGDAGVGVIDGKFYVVGGSAFDVPGPLNIVEVYDPATDTWSTKAPMLTGHAGPAVGVINNILYVAGGQVGDANSSDLGAFVEAYDPTTDTWTRKADMPTARTSLGGAALDGVFYAIGGSAKYIIDTDKGPIVECCKAITTVEAYDPIADSWTTKAPLNVARRALNQVGIIDGTIYVVGGLTNAPQNTPNINNTFPNVTDTVEAYDVGSDSWTFRTPMPTARRFLGVGVANGLLYAVGGEIPGAANVGKPFIYQITATNNPTLYRFPGRFPGINFDGNLGLFYGMPAPETVGNNNLEFDAENSSGASPYVLLAVPVGYPPSEGPVIVSSTSLTGRVGQPLSFQILVDNETTNTRYSVGGLAPGLVIDHDTGLISGTPTSTGNFVSTAVVTDGDAKTVAYLQLSIISDPTVPVISSPDFATLVPGQFFSYTITADVNGNCSYIGTDGVENGALPSGLTFDQSTCTISGTYTGTGNEPASISGSQPENIQVFGHALIAPKTLKIRPPLVGICQLVTNNSNGTGTAPLNFFRGYGITLDASPTDGGSVNGAYNSDGSFTATATTSNCYDFVSWTEANIVQSASATYSFTPTADRSLVANFAKISYTISTSGTGGTLTGAGNYDCGSTVSVSATPDSCHTFVNWMENGVVQSTSPNYQFTASGDRSLVANFSQISYNISTSAGTGGTATGDGTFGCGSTVTVTATADSCHTFVSWTENGVVQSTSPSYQFTLTADLQAAVAA